MDQIAAPNSPTKSLPFHVDTFPKDNRCWRLSWFGNIYRQLLLRIKSPLVRVTLWAVEEGVDGDWTVVPPSSIGPSRLNLGVPIGMLPFLRVGTIWRNGECIADSCDPEESFDLLVSPRTARIAKAGVCESGSFLIPFESHPYHVDHTHSYCVVASTVAGVALIVPAMELIRFYFGSSAGLVARVVNPFDPTRLWSSVRMEAGGKAHIDLAPGISGVSAPDVARIALDRTAWRAASMISASLASVADPRYPKTHFPFLGPTEIAARGQWLQTSAQKSFLVFQLIRCTRSFPFWGLTYTMQRKIPGDATRRVQTASPSAPKTYAFGQTTKTNERTVVNDPPDKAREPKPYAFQSRNRFPDLDRKTVSRVDPTVPTRVVFTGQGEQPEECGVVEADQGGGALAAIDPVSAAETDLPVTHPLANSKFAKFIARAANALTAAGYTVKYVPLSPRQRFPQLSKMPEVILDTGEIHPLSFIETQRVTRPRYVCIMKIEGAFDSVDVQIIPELDESADDHQYDKTTILEPLLPDEELNAVWVASRVAESRIAFEAPQANRGAAP